MVSKIFEFFKQPLITDFFWFEYILEDRYEDCSWCVYKGVLELVLSGVTCSSPVALSISDIGHHFKHAD